MTATRISSARTAPRPRRPTSSITVSTRESASTRRGASCAPSAITAASTTPPRTTSPGVADSSIGPSAAPTWPSTPLPTTTTSWPISRPARSPILSSSGSTTRRFIRRRSAHRSRQSPRASTCSTRVYGLTNISFPAFSGYSDITSHQTGIYFQDQVKVGPPDPDPRRTLRLGETERPDPGHGGPARQRSGRAERSLHGPGRACSISSTAASLPMSAIRKRSSRSFQGRSSPATRASAACPILSPAGSSKPA